MDSFSYFWATNWQWLVPLIVGGVALVLTVSPFLQMIFGRPKLTIGFDIWTVEGGKVLQCELRNPPIKQRFLRKLGIRRMVAEDVVAHFVIKNGDDGSNIIAEIIPSIVSHAGTAPAQRINLPPSIFPCQIGIVIVEDAEHLVRVFQQDRILHSGLYHVFVEVAMEGKFFHAQRSFKVMDKPPFAEWEV